jgi:hypothetical protein
MSIHRPPGLHYLANGEIYVVTKCDKNLSGVRQKRLHPETLDTIFDYIDSQMQEGSGVRRSQPKLVVSEKD